MKVNNLIIILLILTGAAIGYQVGRAVHCQEFELAEIDSTTTTRYDSIPRVIAGEEGVTVLRTSEPVAPLSPIDTAAIIRKHFQKQGYSSTFQNEEIRIKWDASVFQNSLEVGPLSYSILKPVEIKSNITSVKKRSPILFMGGITSHLGIDQPTSFGPSLSLVVKDQFLIGLNYNILGPSKNIGFTLNYRLL